MRKIKNFCCVCTNKFENAVSVGCFDKENLKYVEKLSLCVPKEKWNETYYMCKPCLKQLDIAYCFISACLNSEAFRREQLENNKSLTLNISTEETESCNSKLSNETRQVNFICDQCNKSFSQKKSLSQHITKVHIKRKERLFNKSCIKQENDVKFEAESDKPTNESQDCEEEFSLNEERTNIKKEYQEGDIKEEDRDLLHKCEKSEIEHVTFNKVETGDFAVSTEDDDDDDNDIENENYSQSELESDQDYVEKPTNNKTSSKSRKKTHKRQPLNCNFCDEVFHKRHEWSTHMRTTHVFEKPFSCDQCDARYMNGYSLLIHKRKHTNEKPFICATCGKSFVSSADLNHHNKTHNVDRAYPCPLCDRSFKTHSNLRTHRLQMHLDPAEWKYACDLCNKKFPIRGNLKKHLKRHTGIKEFDCHICAKSFINKAERNLHLNTHSNQRLFKCKMCSKEYKNREGLRRHMKVVHDLGNWKPPVVEKKYLCPMCPKIFAFSNKLQRHIFTHTGEKPYKCDYCQKRFIDSYGRKVHYKKDHNIEYIS